MAKNKKKDTQEPEKLTIFKNVLKASREKEAIKQKRIYNAMESISIVRH